MVDITEMLDHISKSSPKIMEIRMESILENFDLTLTYLRKFAFGIELPLCLKVTATFTFRHSYGQILARLSQGEKMIFKCWIWKDLL